MKSELTPQCRFRYRVASSLFFIKFNMRDSFVLIMSLLLITVCANLDKDGFNLYKGLLNLNIIKIFYLLIIKIVLLKSVNSICCIRNKLKYFRLSTTLSYVYLVYIICYRLNVSFYVLFLYLN